MNIRVLNWNIGGAKFLEKKVRSEREAVRKELNLALLELIRHYDPDVITLQEIVRYKQPNDPDVVDLVDKVTGYQYYSFPLIDSLLFSSQAKWNKVRDGSDWHPHTYFAQGNGMLFRKNARLFPVWDLSHLGEESPGELRASFLKQFHDNSESGCVTPDAELLRAEMHAIRDKKYLIEHIHLDSGLYFGDRDTEPRAALVAHLIVDPVDHGACRSGGPPLAEQRPLDIFIVNLHLVTIMKERVGIPSVDQQAVRMRRAQLDIVFDGIVSRYNSWAADGYPQRGQKRSPEDCETFERRKPVWILCGDFNFTQDSEEYDFIKRRNFIDTTPTWNRRTLHGEGTKAKGAGNSPTLTLDYIFAGPRFIALDPIFGEAGIAHNVVDHGVRVSDHYPVFSNLPMLLPS